MKANKKKNEMESESIKMRAHMKENGNTKVQGVKYQLLEKQAIFFGIEIGM